MIPSGRVVYLIVQLQFLMPMTHTCLQGAVASKPAHKYLINIDKEYLQTNACQYQSKQSFAKLLPALKFRNHRENRNMGPVSHTGLFIWYLTWKIKDN